MKNIIKTVFTIIATLVGAGFASGKEIYSFFFQYGKGGILGIFISSLIISLTSYKVLKICYSNNINTYQEFCIYIIKRLTQNKSKNSIINTSIFINNIINIFLLISFYVMISGFSSFMYQEFNINKIIGSLIIIFLCYIAFRKNIDSLVKISNVLIPIFIILLIYISSKNLEILNNYNNTFPTFKTLRIIYPIIKSILYGSYNCILLIPVLITLKNLITNSNIIYLTSVITYVVIVLLSMCVFNILLLGNYVIFSLDMPLIEIVKRYGNFIRIIYLFMIGSSIYTTAISTGCAFLNGCNSKNYKRNSIIICLSAIFVSQISFSVFVELLYPVLGIIGLIEITAIFSSIFTFNKCKSESS